MGEFENKIGPVFPLSSLTPNGGLTTRIKVTVLREYPTLFFIDDQTAKYGSKRRKGDFIESYKNQIEAKIDLEKGPLPNVSTKQNNSVVWSALVAIFLAL